MCVRACMQYVLVMCIVFFSPPTQPAPAAVARGYQPGISYVYQYSSAVRLKDPIKAGKDVGYAISGEVKVTNVWQNTQEKLLRIELVKPKLHVAKLNVTKPEFVKHSSNLDSWDNRPLYAFWNDGKINTVFVSSESTAETNLKKGIASFLQIQGSSGAVQELDVSGHCKVIYKVEDKTVTKSKESCQHPKKDAQFVHPIKVNSATVIDTSESTYEVDNGIIQSAKGRDTVVMKANLWKDASVLVTSDVSLSLKDQQQGQQVIEAASVQNAVEKLGGRLAKESIVAQPESLSSRDSKSLQGLVSENAKSLKTENLSKLSSAGAFLRVLEKFRLSSQKDIEDVLKNQKNKKILPQLLDIAAATQTEEALNAAMGIIKFQSEEVDIPERFLLTLALASHPSHAIVTDVFKLAKKNIKSDRIKSTALIALGALAKTYNEKQNKDTKLVDDIRIFLESELDACKDDDCRFMYLRALRSAALPKSAPTLWKYATRGGKVATVALKALKNIVLVSLPDKEQLNLLDIYNQVKKRQDSTARVKAAEILFKTADGSKNVYPIITSLSQQDAYETSTLVLAKFLERIETDKRFRLIGKEVLRNHTIANYYTLAQKGSSASFTKLLGETSSLISTYGINMELIPGGLLKASSFDLNLGVDDDFVNFLSVGLFAGGLEKFAGDSNADENTQEETTAGMELTVMGVTLRPYTFFTGTSELMGHVWSGTGSEPISALQGNLLMMDHAQLIVLQNGLVVNIDLRGALSINLEGSIQISLWNRNSHSVVRTSVALMAHGSANILSSFAKSHVQFSIGGEASMDFITDLDFYETPYKMCIQMDQPAFAFKAFLRLTPEEFRHVCNNAQRQLLIRLWKDLKSYAENNHYN